MNFRVRGVVGPLAVALACVGLPSLVAPPTRAAEGADDRVLSFEELPGFVAARNRDLGLAKQGVEAAVADNIAAAARPNPVLSLSANAINPRHPGAGSLWDKPIDAVVQLSQLVERGNKRQLRDDLTRTAIEVARAGLADTLRQQSRAASLAYFDLLQAQGRVRVASETLVLFGRTVAAAQLRLKAGDISPTDLARIKVDQLRAENERRVAQADRERAQQALGYLIGFETEAAGLVAAEKWLNEDMGSMDRNPDEVIAGRPDVRAAVQRLAVADRARELARALRTRDVTVAVQMERYPSQLQNNTVGVGVSAPLFLNYQYDGEIRRAEADRQAAQIALDRVRAAALAELQRARSDLMAARDRVKRFDEELLKEASRAADAAEFAYRNGALGVLDLLDARRIHTATRVDALAARADLARAIVAWRSAVSAQEGTP
ncbi:MAG: TolC family protein [Betaproteobacteria bacterium]